MIRNPTTLIKNLLLLLVVFLSFSCTTFLPLDTALNSYREGDYNYSYQLLLELEKEYLKKQGPLIYALDLGLMSHFNTLYKESNSYLDRAEQLIKELYTESVTANLASYLVNDNTRAYQGEDYEDLYLNIFKALNYIKLQEGEAALVELRRLTEKEQFLKTKYNIFYEKMESQKNTLELKKGQPIKFSTSALGRWLNMVVARDLGEFYDAQFYQNQVKEAFKLQSSLYNFPIPSSLGSELDRKEKGDYRINFVAFSGLAPYKKEVVERFWFSNYNWVKIALPQLVQRESEVASVQVTLSDGSNFRLELIENIGLIAQDTFELKRSATESKTVLRAFLKATGTMAIDIASEVAVSTSNADNRSKIEFWTSLLGFASRVFNEASEQADLRISHFFPDKVWVGGAFVKEGLYDATVTYRNKSGKIVGSEVLYNLKVTKERINLFESIHPR